MDTTNAEPESTIGRSIVSSSQFRYKKILVPHDNKMPIITPPPITAL
jgi:hypothetical protein